MAAGQKGLRNSHALRGRQRKQLSTYYLPTKSHCHSLNGLGVLKRGGNLPPSPQAQERKKNLRLNRKKFLQASGTVRITHILISFLKIAPAQVFTTVPSRQK